MRAQFALNGTAPSSPMRESKSLLPEPMSRLFSFVVTFRDLCLASQNS